SARGTRLAGLLAVGAAAARSTLSAAAPRATSTSTAARCLRGVPRDKSTHGRAGLTFHPCPVPAADYGVGPDERLLDPAVPPIEERPAHAGRKPFEGLVRGRKERELASATHQALL